MRRVGEAGNGIFYGDIEEDKVQGKGRNEKTG